MSLDLYLQQEPETSDEACRECGHVRPVTRTPEVYDANITHNLGGMAEAAGLYEVLWFPENQPQPFTAGQLAVVLERGIADMKADPEKYRKHDAPNGWGIYDDFLPWLERLLVACKQYPNTFVRASR